MSSPLKVYLAARYSRRYELGACASALQVAGYQICSRWLWGGHESSQAAVFTERQQWALEDWEDLARADICIAFTEIPYAEPGRGGRHVELGAALAWCKRVLVVGPVENVFVCLPQVERYSTWEEALEALTQWEAPGTGTGTGGRVIRRRLDASSDREEEEVLR